jgi:rhodanese-related sulfurtransferase
LIPNRLTAKTWACLAMLACCLPSLAAQAYTLSHAQVTPDPLYSRPEFSDKWPHFNLAEAKRLQGRPGVVFVDGRGYQEWQSSHIPGALPLPVGEFDKRFPMVKRKLARAKIVVTYCHGASCGLAETLAQLLSDQGLRNVAVFYEGFPAWAESGQALEDAPSKP